MKLVQFCGTQYIYIMGAAFVGWSDVGDGGDGKQDIASWSKAGLPVLLSFHSSLQDCFLII